LFLIFSLLSTSQFLYYFQCCVVFSVGTICVLQYDVLYWLVWYCLSGVVRFLKFCLEALVFLGPPFQFLEMVCLRWDTPILYFLHDFTDVIVWVLHFFSFFFFPFSIKHIFCIPSLNFLCSQMLMWSKVSCKQPWSRIMCNPTF